MKSDTPASIPVAAMAFAATIAPAIGYFLGIESAGVLVLAALINGGAGLAVAIYLNKTTTSSTAPVLEPNTEVAVKGTADTVIVQPTPPGPTGIEDGGAQPPPPAG